MRELELVAITHLTVKMKFLFLFLHDKLKIGLTHKPTLKHRHLSHLMGI